MQIWVDADACPRVIREILYRAANRTGLSLTLVANQALAYPRSQYVSFIQVPRGIDVADDRIVDELKAGDIVVTADIPLAAAAVAKGANALDPRGQLYDTENIQQRLTMRNFMEELRSAGTETGGPAPFSKRDQQNFANQLDRLLAQQ